MFSTKIRFSFMIGAILATIGIPVTSWAEDLEISDSPLFVAVSIGPNVMFTLDDSGSMQFEFMPSNDITRQGDADWGYLFPGMPSDVYDSNTYFRDIPTFKDDPINSYFRSSNNNNVYYDPTTEYEPWTKPTGELMDDADPSAAYWNPVRTGVGTYNLRTEKEDVDTDGFSGWIYTGTDNIAPIDADDDDFDEQDFWPMVYWIYKGSGSVYETDSYDKVEIRNGSLFINGSSANISDLNALTGMDRSSVAEEEQNFANWFQYYRSRILTTRAGIGKAFDVLPSRTRVGFGAINKGGTTVDGQSHDTVVEGLRDFDGTGRGSFYERLYEWPMPTSGTPLRSAAIDVGNYFFRDDDRGPWSTTPGQDGGRLLSCRQSYHILMTDGFWNGGANVSNHDNLDGPTHTSPTGASYTYEPTAPFSDTYDDTLADIAMYFWNRDLLPDVDNLVPTTEINPAFWQHLALFGVGLGVEGAVNAEAAFAAIESGDDINWPDPTDGEDLDRIDDLLHASVNARGGFFSASNPVVFATQLSEILLEIVSRSNSTTSVAVSATRLTTESLVYAASFDSEDWSGELAALNAESGDTEFLATETLAAQGPGGRNVFSFNPDNDTSLNFDSSAADPLRDRLMENAPTGADWTAENLIAYIIGDDSNEQRNGGPFRNRDVILGDIINSRPFYSGAGNEGWSTVDEDYIEYISEDKNDPRDCDELPDGETCNYARKDTLFIGSNGGMLHAFDARTLEEFFAFVPSSVHGNLEQLARPSYEHKFFVDGQIAVADAKLGGSWGTYLVGTLGAGGRGIYAMDVTDPESAGAGDVLWELTAEDDPDLGFTFGEPIISRLEDGTWVAVFGNGYNSTDNQGWLYVVDLADGDVLHKVEVGEAGSNGLSGVVGWRDAGTRQYLERVYVGDLNGTVWRVDFSSSDPSVVYDDGLFTDPDNRAITATPNVAANPSGGLMVYFGTGKLIENTDRLEVQTERFYAIRDLGSPVSNNLGGSQLSEVEIDGFDGDGNRILGADEVGPSGWYFETQDGSATGERTLSKPRVVFGRVIFSTYEPVEDPCTPGGLQRTYVLDAIGGSGVGLSIGIGAPVSPPVTIKQPSPGGGEVTFPGNPNPDEPGDPDDFDDPPDSPPNVIREGWCSEFGIPPLVEGGQFLPLGSICEGRQVWREIR